MKEQGRRVYYKVVDGDLRSLGLKPNGRQVTKIQYKVGQWVYPLEPTSPDPNEGGGLWVCQKRSDALSLARYVRRRYGQQARIFECWIGKILCQPSLYRTKTNKVMLLNEIT